MASPRRFPWTARLSAFALSAGMVQSLAAESPNDDDPGTSAAWEEGYVAREGLPLPELRAGELDLTGSLRPQELYLEVFHDDRPTGRIARVRLHNGGLSATADVIRDMGLVLPAEMVESGGQWIPLDSLPGLSYRYEVETQRLYLHVPPTLRPLQWLGYSPPPAVEVRRDMGLLMSYDVYGRELGGDRWLSAASSLRWFGRAGALEQVGLTRVGDDATAYRRLETRWTYSDPERMWTWAAGDVISGGLTWSRPVRIGGVQWRRNFGVRPDLITLPMPRFTADATVPSSVELYVDNIRQFGTEVQDGPFVLDMLPRISGAGEASLVVTDILGRVTETSVPIYVDHRRLAPGLTDFSLEAGVLRRGFTGAGNEYGSDLVGSASLRHGVTDTLTVESHAEAGPGLRLGGAGVLWSPRNRWGLISASYARSGGDGTGGQYTLGYQWTARGYGFDAHTLRRDDGYRDLGDLGRDPEFTSFPAMRDQDRLTLWMPVGRGSLSFTWLRWRDFMDETNRTRSLSWTQSFTHLSLSAGVFDDDVAGRGGSMTVSVPLGDRTYGSASLRRSHGDNSAVGAVRRSAPYDGGWGWSVQGGDRPGSYAQAAAEFRGRAGETEFGVDRVRGDTGTFFQGRGSVVVMDGRVFFSRRIYDAFAVVSTDGRGDMPVLSENRSFGRTRDDGYLLVPELRGWQRNRIAIDPDELPPNYRVGELEQMVTPADRAGVLVHFDVTRVHPAVITLLGPDGEHVPAGSRGRLVDSGLRVVAGFDGEVYVENLTRETAIEIEINGRRCHYPLPQPEPDADGVQRHGPVRCERMGP